MKYTLSDEARCFLLFAARASIASLFGQKTEIIEPDPEVSAEVNAHRGCFVTLNIGGRLRGCIGTFSDDTPLLENVQGMAKAAAESDPRFSPLSEAELEQAEIEISALTPFIPVDDVSVITVGRDGLIVVKGNRSGVLLPQVAEERGWDAETFLAQTSIKAGLAPDAWKDEDTRILRFMADVFAEGAVMGGGCGGCC